MADSVPTALEEEQQWHTYGGAVRGENCVYVGRKYGLSFVDTDTHGHDIGDKPPFTIVVERGNMIPQFVRSTVHSLDRSKTRG